MKLLSSILLSAAIASATSLFAAVPATSDDFESETLGSQWHWKNAPADAAASSLTDAPGKLRLKNTTTATDAQTAPGTLTQPLAPEECSATVKINTNNMKEGDIAGFGVITGSDDALLSVKARGIRRYVVLEENNADKLVIPMQGHTVYLRVETDADHHATLSFSSDGEEWTRVGGDFNVTPASELAIYNFATKTTGGSVDVDFFHIN